MGLNKLHNLKINSDVLSSRFVVDLKQNLPKPEVKITKPRNIEEKLEKLAEIDYGKIISKGKTRVGEIFSYFDFRKNLSDIKSFWIAGQARNDKFKKSVKKFKLTAVATSHSKLDQLALMGLGKLLFVLFCKICYAAGWAIMFILRLVYFLLLIIASPVIKIIKFLFFRFQASIFETLNILPAGVKATQIVAVSMFVRLLHLAKKNTIPHPPPYQGGVIGYLKPVLVFAGVLLIIILPVKAFTYYKFINIVRGKVLGASEIAMGDLISAGEAAVNFNFSRAGQSFESAGHSFLSAQKELEEINGLIFTLAAVAPDKNTRLAASSKNILRAGELSAHAGQNLSLAMNSLFNHKIEGVQNILENLSFYGHKAIANLSELAKILDQINSDVLPENYQTEFILLKQKAGGLNRGLNEFIGLADSLKNLLGMSAAKRYLLVFQNNAELRASGGFLGSFALIDFSQGEIKNIETPGGGSYDTEAGFLKKIKAPEPLSLVRPDWHFWDANWWPDWRLSARKLAWFYENSDGSTVDGVISFTPTVMEKLLKIIGPIDMKDKYGLVFDADNFWLETQKLAEQKPDITKQPKKIIGDLMNEIMAELPKRLNKDNLLPLFKAMNESLISKNILFYFTDEELAAKVDDLDWGGRIKNTAGDYLNVINTNIAGGKSDRKIKQEIIHKTKIQPDGSIIDDLTVRRVHGAVKREPFSGVRNVDWVRVYVPLGSELLAASGFKPVDKIFFSQPIAGLADDPDVLAGEGQARTDEVSGTKIYNEFNKTVFAGWSQLDPGETIEINIKYKLPFKLTDKKQPANLMEKASALLNPEQNNLYSYSLLAQKQPGMNSSTIESQLELSDNFAPIWKYPANLGASPNGWSMSENLDQDKMMGLIVEEK